MFRGLAPPDCPALIGASGARTGMSTANVAPPAPPQCAAIARISTSPDTSLQCRLRLIVQRGCYISVLHLARTTHGPQCGDGVNPLPWDTCRPAWRCLCQLGLLLVAMQLVARCSAPRVTTVLDSDFAHTCLLCDSVSLEERSGRRLSQRRVRHLCCRMHA